MNRRSLIGSLCYLFIPKSKTQELKAGVSTLKPVTLEVKSIDYENIILESMKKMYFEQDGVKMYLRSILDYSDDEWGICGSTG